MSDRRTREALLGRGTRAALIVALATLAALAAGPAWAQRRGGYGGPPMRMPPMSIPRMAPPMRPAPMPRPTPQPMRPPENMPRNNPASRLPRPVSHARPPERMPASGSGSTSAQIPPAQGQRQTTGGYTPTRIPVYTPMTSSSYRARRFALKTLQNQQAAPLYYFSPDYWGGYGWNPYLFGFGGSFFADPFDSPFFTGAGCFTFSPFASPFFGPSLFCNNWSSSALFDPNCPLCNTLGFDPFALGLNNASFLYPSLTLTPASASLFGGTASSSSPAPAGSAASRIGLATPAQEGDALSSGPPPEPPSDLSSSPFATNQPAQGEPLTLVFANGTTLRATQYSLSNDGQLHYVTTSDDAVTVPLTALDMPATMKANSDKGVEFLAPEPERNGLASTSPSGFLAPSEPSSQPSATPFATNQPAPGEPLTLVFANGTTLRATQYSLDNDGQLHYVTTSGETATVPLAALDMPATMEANRDKGVQFLAPAPEGTQPPQNP